MGCLNLPVLLIEFFIAHGEEQDKFDESNEGWDKCPAEKKVHDPQPNLTQIKLMPPNAPQKERKERSRYSVFAVRGNWA